MIWNVIAIVLTAIAVLGVYAFWLSEDGFFGLLVGTFFNLFTLLVAFGIYCLGGLIISSIVGEHRSTHQDQLVAVSDERNQWGGAFFLGIGAVGSDPQYTFYYASPDGGRHLETASPDRVTVYEDAAPDHPYVVWNDSAGSKHPGIVDDFAYDGTYLQAIHVPPHSIKTGIVLGVPQK